MAYYEWGSLDSWSRLSWNSFGERAKNGSRSRWIWSYCLSDLFIPPLCLSPHQDLHHQQFLYCSFWQTATIAQTLLAVVGHIFFCTLILLVVTSLIAYRSAYNWKGWNWFTSEGVLPIYPAHPQLNDILDGYAAPYLTFLNNLWFLVHLPNSSLIRHLQMLISCSLLLLFQSGYHCECHFQVDMTTWLVWDVALLLWCLRYREISKGVWLCRVLAGCGPCNLQLRIGRAGPQCLF